MKNPKNETKDSDEPDLKKFQKKIDYVSWIVFLFSLSLVLTSLVSVVFPTLIASNNSTLSELEELGISIFEVNPFEVGVWAGPLLATSIIVFTLTILYFKKKLPKSLTKLFEFIFTFEISKKTALITIVVILAIYIGFSAQELTVEEEWEDYPGVKQRVLNWSPEQVTRGFEPHVKYFFLWASMKLFGYFTVLPFIASISLLLLTYFFTAKISKKRFAGVVSMVILLQSNLFLTYDTTVAYSNFWILFYLLSLFLIYKAWPLSPVSFLLSIPSKAITASFLPLSLFFIFRSEISKRRKIIIASATSGIILVGILVSAGTGVSGTEGQEEFDSNEFWLGFASFSYQLRFDGLVLVFILPLIVGLFIASRHKILHAESIMILISGMLLISPILTGFTEFTNQPYRWVPLVVFFAVGIGILLSKKQV